MEYNIQLRSKKLVGELLGLGKTISCMESCTGGALTNEITNIDGSSGVIKFSAVTYSNEYKVKIGVDSDIITKYSVYSLNVACEMSRAISLFTGSDYGVGITGKLNRADENNNSGSDDTVFISVYDKSNNVFYQDTVHVSEKTRAENKSKVVDRALNLLLKNI